MRRAQVVIESLIVEMTADKAAEFGIQWQALGALENNDTGVIAGTNFGGGGTNIIGGAQNIGSLGQGLNLGVVRGKITIPGIGEVINLAFLARALQTTADANILSTPTIQTLDNEEAKFLVGQNIPLITGSYAAAGGTTAAGVNPFQTFERRDIGLQLRVKPQITEGGVVRLAIYQELSSIQNTLTAAQGGIITNKRSFESTVLVEDGNIVVLGGLIEDRTDNSRSSLPILGSIPGLGYLFSYENRSRKKTNLFVFLRPYVVRDEGTSSALALDRYAYIRGQVADSSIPDNLIFRGLQGQAVAGDAAGTACDAPGSGRQAAGYATRADEQCAHEYAHGNPGPDRLRESRSTICVRSTADDACGRTGLQACTIHARRPLRLPRKRGPSRHRLPLQRPLPAASAPVPSPSNDGDRSAGGRRHDSASFRNDGVGTTG